jgi:transcription initiation factor IIE alpha subunit
MKKTVKAQYPCCKSEARFPFYEAVKTELYERTCPKCGKEWDVRRSEVVTIGSDGSRVDRFDWEHSFRD